MPDASPERGHVDGIRIRRVRNYAMSPLEIKARYSRPVFPAIYRTPSRGFESGSIKEIWVSRINGHIINVAIAIKDLPPRPAGILREENPAAVTMHSSVPRPGGKVKPIWRKRIYGEAVRTIYP